MADHTPVGRLILVPALLTLGVTLLRLAGEIMNGSPVLFSRARRPVGARSRAGGRRAVFRLATSAMPKRMRDMIWLLRGLRGLALRQR